MQSHGMILWLVARAAFLNSLILTGTILFTRPHHLNLTFPVSWATSHDLSIYKRQDNGQTFSLVQNINASDYGEGFGNHFTVDMDTLVVRSTNQTHVFSLENGYFEEAFVLDEAYKELRLSGNNLYAYSYDNETTILTMQDCVTRPTPAPMPTAPSPSYSPSKSLKPTLSFDQSKTMTPSHTPTLSSVPSSTCFGAKLVIVTGVDNTVSWELYDKQSDEVILNEAELQSETKHEHNITCLRAGVYAFNITSEEGNGFGGCDYPYILDDPYGYDIYVDGGIAGESGKFWKNEVQTFSVYDRNLKMLASSCIHDFHLALMTDDSPEDIQWVLANENTGDVLLSGKFFCINLESSHSTGFPISHPVWHSGGPYQGLSAGYTESICLNDGKYNFTVFNSEVNANTTSQQANATVRFRLLTMRFCLSLLECLTVSLHFAKPDWLIYF